MFYFKFWSYGLFWQTNQPSLFRRATRKPWGIRAKCSSIQVNAYNVNSVLYWPPFCSNQNFFSWHTAANFSWLTLRWYESWQEVHADGLWQVSHFRKKLPKSHSLPKFMTLLVISTTVQYSSLINSLQGLFRVSYNWRARWRRVSTQLNPSSLQFIKNKML